MARVNRRAEASRQADEDYLKTALLLKLQYGHVYVSDLAEELGANLATAYSSVNKLAIAGYILPLERRGGRRSNKQSLSFTPEGERLARQILSRNQLIKSWLVQLGIPEEDAEDEACYMEHGISEHTLAVLKRYMDVFLKEGEEWRAAQSAGRNETPDGKDDAGGIADVALRIDEQTEIIVEMIGGIEGAKKKQSLVERGGGEERLEEILNAVEEMGGPEAFTDGSETFRRSAQIVSRYGGPDAAEEALNVFESLGGRKNMKRLARFAELFGGDFLLGLLENQEKTWRKALCPEEEHDFCIT